ncbi:MAG: hypothetical protein QM743_01135 [Chitinophagaceae bacterium]
MTIAKETQEIIKAAKAASQMAQREAKALELVVRLILNGTIYDKYPDGKMIAIGAVERKQNLKLKKGMVLKLKNEQA